jgi:tetratricopeptide (TPR) repeat protein
VIHERPARRARRIPEGDNMSRGLKILLTMAVSMAACDQFVCNQARIRAMEHNNAGITAFNNGLYDSAERELKLAIQTDPSYELSHYNLGKVYQKQRKWDKAIEAFEGATQRAPGNANYHYDLGEAYLETKQLEKAEGALKKASEADPKLFKAHWRLGLVYKLLERPKEADAALRAAIEANARFDRPFVDLGNLYLDYDAAKEAAQVFSECVRANELSAECHNGHGMSLKELKLFEQATAEFKKALEIEPGLTNAVYNAGMTYAEWYEQTRSNEHRDRAREYLQKFVSSAGSKDGGFGYVKAANDKLYALSGT